MTLGGLKESKIYLESKFEMKRRDLGEVLIPQTKYLNLKIIEDIEELISMMKYENSLRTLEKRGCL